MKRTLNKLFYRFAVISCQDFYWRRFVKDATGRKPFDISCLWEVPVGLFFVPFILFGIVDDFEIFNSPEFIEETNRYRDSLGE